MVDRRHSLEGIPKKKVFGGNEYLLRDSYRTKKDADYEARHLRTTLGDRARVVKVRNLAFPYAVYYRPIKGWKTPKQSMWKSRREK